jgi:hypothetical protein
VIRSYAQKYVTLLYECELTVFLLEFTHKGKHINKKGVTRYSQNFLPLNRGRGNSIRTK